MNTMTDRYYLNMEALEKAKKKVEDADGVLTPHGMQIAHEYARQWLEGVRAVEVEWEYPELVGLFYDIRHDRALANEHALPLGKSLSVGAGEAFVLDAGLFKAGPYIGPRGGKWADPAHTIPWKEGAGKKKQARKEAEDDGPDWVEHYRHDGYQTIDEFRINDDPPEYTEDRTMRHEEIIRSFLLTKSGTPIAPPPPDTVKTAIVLMGGPASGKTSLVGDLVGTKDFAEAGFANVNPDDVKEHLPEYNEAKGMLAKDAAACVHRESSDVASLVYNRALERGLNMVVDGTGRDLQRHLSKVKQLRDAGYNVKLVMPDIGVEEAQRRQESRAKATGRYVPEHVLVGAHSIIPGNFEPIARECDEFFLYDNKVALDEPAKLKWSGRRGQPDVIHDERWVQNFKTKAEVLPKRLARKSLPAFYFIEQGETEMKKSGKESGTKKPALTAEEMAENLRNPQPKEKQPVKYPNAGKDGNGFVWPVEEFVPNDYGKK